jgi:hypothetical protein
MNTYKFRLRNKDKIWYLNDNWHRDHDRPAVILAYGTKWWLQYGKKHRDNDKPAYIRYDGYKEWYQYGKSHRANDKPACIWSDGTKWWLQYGNLPARIWPDGRMEYWVNGERIK